MKKILEEIKEIISKELEIDLKNITDDSNLIDDLGADNLDIIELIMDMEDYFGITVLDEDIEDLITVNDIYKIVKKYLKK